MLGSGRGTRTPDHSICSPCSEHDWLPPPMFNMHLLRSPGVVSGKLEYFKYRRETVGDFALKSSNLESGDRSPICKSPPEQRRDASRAGSVKILRRAQND